MATTDPLAVRRVLGAAWVISNDEEEKGAPSVPPPDLKPTPQPYNPGTIPTDHPAVPHKQPFAYRIVYGRGPTQGFVGVCCLALGVFFFMLPSSTLTLWFGGIFMSVAWVFFCAAGCCWGPVSNHIVVNNNGYTGMLSPVAMPNWRPGGPAVVPGTMPYARV